jgi:hypothetical protein
MTLFDYTGCMGIRDDEGNRDIDERLASGVEGPPKETEVMKCPECNPSSR